MRACVRGWSTRPERSCGVRLACNNSVSRGSPRGSGGRANVRRRPLSRRHRRHASEPTVQRDMPSDSAQSEPVPPRAPAAAAAASTSTSQVSMGGGTSLIIGNLRHAAPGPMGFVDVRADRKTGLGNPFLLTDADGNYCKALRPAQRCQGQGAPTGPRVAVQCGVVASSSLSQRGRDSTSPYIGPVVPGGWVLRPRVCSVLYPQSFDTKNLTIIFLQ